MQIGNKVLFDGVDTNNNLPISTIITPYIYDKADIALFIHKIFEKWLPKSSPKSDDLDSQALSVIVIRVLLISQMSPETCS